MLILEPTAAIRSSFWAPGAAFAILRDDATIGRIDMGGRPARDEVAGISLGERSFECHIHPTGKARWTYVPSRWVMYSGESAMYGATWENSKTFLIDGQNELEPLRLRKESGGSFAVERASDQVRVGEIKWRKCDLLPKLVPIRIVLEMSVDLPETFEVFLLWIAGQNNFRTNAG
jgi:hypothetical protein